MAPGELSIIPELREYLLSHAELNQQQARAQEGKQNHLFFYKDYLDGILDRYKDSAVAYQKGVLCGQSDDPLRLWAQASAYYGGNALSIFIVPDDASGLEESVRAEINNLTSCGPGAPK